MICVCVRFETFKRERDVFCLKVDRASPAPIKMTRFARRQLCGGQICFLFACVRAHLASRDHASLFHRGGSVWKKEACDKWRVGSPSFGEDGCWSPLCSTCGLLCRLNETAARARARHACCSPADLARPRVAGASSSSQRSTGGAVCPLLALAPPAVPRESITLCRRNQPEMCLLTAPHGSAKRTVSSK